MALTFLAFYGLGIFLVARHSGRKTGRAAFFVNNRASGPVGVCFSILVSCVGASATIGMIGLAYSVGTPAFWWLGSGAGGLLVLSLVLAKAVRRSRAYTLPHLAGKLLGRPVRPLLAAVIAVAWTAILGAQFVALVTVLEGFTGLGRLPCLGISFVLITGHALGGQAAVMRADRVQAWILLGALALLLGWMTALNPGWPGQVAIEIVNPEFPPARWLYFMVVVGANYLVCPMLFGRLYAARDARSARLGGCLAALALMLCAGLIVAAGLAARGLAPPGTDPDGVLTALLAGVLPGWLGLLITIALISAIVSSADSCLITAATVICLDLCGRSNPAAARGCALFLACLGAALTLWGKSILDLLLMAYDVYACGVVMPVCVGLAAHQWSRRTALRATPRLDPRLACLAVLLGGMLGAAAAVSGETLYSYAGLALSALLTLVGYALAKRDTLDLQTFAACKPDRDCSLLLPRPENGAIQSSVCIPSPSRSHGPPPQRREDHAVS